MKLDMNKIECAAQSSEPEHVHGYKVSVFDVSHADALQTENTNIQYHIHFIDECGAFSALIEIESEGNIIHEMIGDKDLLIAAGFLDEDES